MKSLLMKLAISASGKEPEMQQSKELSSLAYIDTAVMERVKPETEPRNEDRERANKEGRSFIAGFDLLDPEREKAALDAIINKRNESILKFLDDRKAVRAKFDKLGIAPLAVVPRGAWADICHKSGLIVMMPNGNGQVTISRRALREYPGPTHAEVAAKQDYTKFVRSLFPQTMGEGMYAKVVLPTPPADVAATLMKAKGLELHVAAVPEAIRFVQTPTELYNAATVDPRDEWARRQGYADYKDWVKRDPIVFHNHGSASAIIAQFGEFPIEKEVVDLVIAGDNLIPESPVQATNQGMTAGYQDINEAYRRYAQLGMQQATQQMQQEGFFQALGTGGGMGSVTSGGTGAWVSSPNGSTFRG